MKNIDVSDAVEAAAKSYYAKVPALLWPSPCLQHGWIVGGLPLHRALELASRCGMCRVPGRGLS